MAEAISGKEHRTTASSGGEDRQTTPPSRLQSRAPASLQISPAAPQWNVAIPLLTPLATLPTSPPRPATGDRPQVAEQPQESKKPPIFKKWQHPAAPFSYEPGPCRSSFVPV